MRVAAHQGLEAVSLRHVATEAGVSTGMVQHYFRTKDEMMTFATGPDASARRTAARRRPGGSRISRVRGSEADGRRDPARRQRTDARVRGRPDPGRAGVG